MVELNRFIAPPLGPNVAAPPNIRDGSKAIRLVTSNLFRLTSKKADRIGGAFVLALIQQLIERPQVSGSLRAFGHMRPRE